MVGDGRTYSVGTAHVGPPPPLSNPSEPRFSGRPAEYADPNNWGPYGTRQAVVVQIATPGDDSGITKQAVYHGYSSIGGSIGRPSFAHAIAVWPASAPIDVRIAICGSTREEELPNSPTGPNPASGGTVAVQTPESGFIAVFDGELQLRWSYHFFEANTNARTVITDLSIRVENGIEYVTYCGASNNGNAPGMLMNTMLPVRPFQAPPTISIDVYAGGDAHNSNPLAPYGQWDGIVGRLSAAHAVTNPTPTIDFHSIVGGGADDILLGISQPSLDRFAVVGSTRSPAASGLAFPLTATTLFGSGEMHFHSSSFWELGTFLEFEAPDMTVASPGTTTNPNPDYYLKLKKSYLIGSEGSRTVARDVLWQSAQSGLSYTYVVGSTNYPGLATDFSAADTGTFYGGSSGFLVATLDLPQFGWITGRYLNQEFTLQSSGQTIPPAGQLATATGAHGIAAWNEYPNHFSVVGWSEHAEGTRILTSTCFREPAGAPGLPIRILRQHEFNPAVDPASRDDMPGAYVGVGFHSTVNILPVSSDLGKATSGGIAVNEKGHVATVGHTRLPVQPPTPTPHHPVTGPLGEFRGPMPQDPLTDQVDGLRVELDMLPLGAYFLDAESSQLGVFGGTSPTCALSPFGNTLGPAALQRIYLSIDGDPAPNADINIQVDRPTDGSAVLGGLFLGFPAVYPSPLPGIELLVDLSAALMDFSFIVTGDSIRVPLQLPAVGGEFSVQFVCLLGNTNFCSTVPACANTTPCLNNLALGAAASPALWITF